MASTRIAQIPDTFVINCRRSRLVIVRSASEIPRSGIDHREERIFSREFPSADQRFLQNPDIRQIFINPPPLLIVLLGGRHREIGNVPPVLVEIPHAFEPVFVTACRMGAGRSQIAVGPHDAVERHGLPQILLLITGRIDRPFAVQPVEYLRHEGYHALVAVAQKIEDQHIPIVRQKFQRSFGVPGVPTVADRNRKGRLADRSEYSARVIESYVSHVLRDAVGTLRAGGEDQNGSAHLDGLRVGLPRSADRNRYGLLRLDEPRSPLRYGKPAGQHIVCSAQGNTRFIVFFPKGDGNHLQPILPGDLLIALLHRLESHFRHDMTEIQRQHVARKRFSVIRQFGPQIVWIPADGLLVQLDTIGSVTLVGRQETVAVLRPHVIGQAVEILRSVQLPVVLFAQRDIVQAASQQGLLSGNAPRGETFRGVRRATPAGPDAEPDARIEHTAFARSPCDGLLFPRIQPERTAAGSEVRRRVLPACGRRQAQGQCAWNGRSVSLFHNVAFIRSVIVVRRRSRGDIPADSVRLRLPSRYSCLPAAVHRCRT